MEMTIYDKLRDFELTFTLDADENVTGITVCPGLHSNVPYQRTVLSTPVPLIPNFIRIESIVAREFLAPCTQDKVRMAAPR